MSLLERRLGIALVRRTRRGIQATGPGSLLADHASAAMDRLARAEADVRALAGRSDAPPGLADGRLDAAIVFEHDFEPAERRDGIRLVPPYQDPVRGAAAGPPFPGGPGSIRLTELTNETTAVQAAAGRRPATQTPAWNE